MRGVFLFIWNCEGKNQKEIGRKLKEEKKRTQFENKIERWFSARNLSLMVTFIFAILLIPVLYLTFVNRASGDDYGYGVYTRAAWMGTHSLIEVGKAIWRTIKQYYFGWQGTWFSIALFALQPEVFSDHAYVIVAPLMLVMWIGSTFYLFWQILGRKLGMDKWNRLLITMVFSLIGIQFVPSTKSAIFWYNGCAHYMIPFAMCQMATVWLMKYEESYRKRDLIGSILFMSLLGGANYQVALLVLIAAFYVGIASWFRKRDKRIFLLSISVMTELAGLIVSMKAPGNKVRAGEEFGFSLAKGMETIVFSFVYGIRDLGTYAKERPLVFVGLLFLFLLLLLVFIKQKNIKTIKYPIWLILMLYCAYSAMQAPAIYAGVEVSRGVLNTNFQIFMLTVSGILLIVAERLAVMLKGKWGEMAERKACMRILLPGICICMLLTLSLRSNIKDSTSYVCLSYITSGQAADYKEQMDLQTKLLEDTSTEDVVVPFINDVQGPLMHMPVTDDPDAWTNKVTRDFYGKNSVVAMERPGWMELYGERR